MCFTQTSPTRINHSFSLGEAVALCNHGGNANHPKLAYSAVYKPEHESLSFPPTQALDRMPHPRMKAKNLRLGIIRSMFQKTKRLERYRHPSTGVSYFWTVLYSNNIKFAAMGYKHPLGLETSPHAQLFIPSILKASFHFRGSRFVR